MVICLTPSSTDSIQTRARVLVVLPAGGGSETWVGDMSATGAVGGAGESGMAMSSVGLLRVAEEWQESRSFSSVRTRERELASGDPLPLPRLGCQGWVN